MLQIPLILGQLKKKFVANVRDTRLEITSIVAEEFNLNHSCFVFPGQRTTAWLLLCYYVTTLQSHMSPHQSHYT